MAFVEAGSFFGPYPDPLPEKVAISLPPGEELKTFCRRWRIKDMAIYGHVLEDVDPEGKPMEVMVAFWKPGQWTLNEITRMGDLLSEKFGRECRVIERAEVDVSGNHILRQRIYRSVKTLYREL